MAARAVEGVVMVHGCGDYVGEDVVVVAVAVELMSL